MFFFAKMFKLGLKGYIVLSKACVLFTLTQLAKKCSFGGTFAALNWKFNSFCSICFIGG